MASPVNDSYSVASGATLYAGRQGMPAWVTALPLMQWYRIPNTTLADTPPTPYTPPGSTGPQSKIIAYNGACLKRSGSVYMLGAAGGHNDYGGNEVNALALNTATPGWVQLVEPTPLAQIYANGTEGTQWYADLRPSATHTYQATQFIDSLNRMVIFNSPGYNGSGGAWPPPSTAPWTTAGLSFSFSVADGDWDEPTYIAATPATGDFPQCLCVKHPTTDDVYYSMNFGNGWWRWNAASNTWTDLPGASRNPWYSGAAIDPTRNRIFTAGGYPSEIAPRLYDLDGVEQSITATGAAASLLNSDVTQYPAVCYDEACDCFWVLYTKKNGEGGRSGVGFLRVNAGTWEVTTPSTTGTGPKMRGSTVVTGLVSDSGDFHNSLQYVPELKGLVIADDYNDDVLFMRTAL